MPSDRATSALAPGRRATLQLVCRTFLPALEPHFGDEAALFAASADSLDILPQVERAIAALPAAQFKET
ncbi:MAG TPA: hypothetical protein VK864_01840, partial [Longimicrobiales bacterium]|nr:hypothetical protein [Longimicrobiales bacterium]